MRKLVATGKSGNKYYLVDRNPYHIVCPENQIKEYDKEDNLKHDTEGTSENVVRRCILEGIGNMLFGAEEFTKDFADIPFGKIHEVFKEE